MPERPLIEIQNLRVDFKVGRVVVPAVRDVSFSIGKGRTVGLVGESGSGKSTIANAILGLVPTTGGQILLDDEDIASVTAARRRTLTKRLQVVFQDPFGSLNPARTVGETLRESLWTAGMTRRERDAAIVKVIDDVGLSAGALRKYPREFSGGQRQRIAIARAIVNIPDLLVLDESVSALDLSVQAQILNLLLDIQAETSMAFLFISHDLDVIRHMAHETVVLKHGELVEQGLTAQIVTEPRSSYTQALLAARLVPDVRKQQARREARRRAQKQNDSAR